MTEAFIYNEEDWGPDLEPLPVDPPGWSDDDSGDYHASDSFDKGYDQLTENDWEDIDDYMQGRVSTRAVYDDWTKWEEDREYENNSDSDRLDPLLAQQETSVFVKKPGSKGTGQFVEQPGQREVAAERIVTRTNEEKAALIARDLADARRDLTVFRSSEKPVSVRPRLRFTRAGRLKR